MENIRLDNFTLSYTNCYSRTSNVPLPPYAFEYKRYSKHCIIILAASAHFFSYVKIVVWYVFSNANEQNTFCLRMECNTYCNGNTILEHTKEYSSVKLLLNNIYTLEKKDATKDNFITKVIVE